MVRAAAAAAGGRVAVVRTRRGAVEDTDRSGQPGSRGRRRLTAAAPISRLHRRLQSVSARPPRYVRLYTVLQQEDQLSPRDRAVRNVS